MSRYFSKFPKLVYTKDNSSKIITNLVTRIATVKGTLDNISLFYEYQIQEGDTPEIVASKYYNDAELHWVVLIFNDIFDPFYDWPMTYQQFQTYITDKYGSISSAMTTNHHYEKIIEKIDSLSGEKTRDVFIIDYDSYMTLVPNTQTKVFDNGAKVTVSISKREVDNYMYEEELNESKRKIKLIKPELIPDIKNQFQFLMGQ